MEYEIVEIKAYAIIEIDAEGSGKELVVYSDRGDAEDCLEELQADPDEPRLDDDMFN